MRLIFVILAASVIMWNNPFISAVSLLHCFHLQLAIRSSFKLTRLSGQIYQLRMDPKCENFLHVAGAAMNLVIKGLNFSLPGAATRHLNPGQLSRSSRSYVRMSLAKEGMDTAKGAGPLVWRIPDSKGLGPETVEQVTTSDNWNWLADTHWKHWHGFWTQYFPEKSKEVCKEYKSVRSLQMVDPERTRLFHRNQWYDVQGFGADIKWEYGPWNITMEEHNLADGILHPNSIDHRILCFPSGNNGWIQMYLKPNDPRSVVFSELFFYPNPKMRMSVPVGYDNQGFLGVSLLLEEVKDSEEKLESSWTGTLWQHSRAPVEETRDEPNGTYRGHEEALTPQLVMTKREAEWQGFKGGVLVGEDAAAYTLVHMPNNVTVFAPKAPAIGKDFAFYVTWVESEARVRVASCAYGADLKLAYIKFGVYDKVK